MHPERIVLTQARLVRLAAPKRGRQIVYDVRLPGFGVRLTPAGVRTFIVYRKIAGRPQIITLGRFPAVSVEQARKAASEILGHIARGENPMDSRRATRREMLLGQLWTEYLERHAKERKRTWQSDAARWRLYLAPWASRRLSRITCLEVQKLHSRVGREKGHYAANRLLALISRMFNLARRWGYASENPAEGIERFHETQRQRFLQPTELPHFFRALAEEPSGDVRDYVLLSLLTGARKGNVLAMRWADVDLDAGTWTIPGDQSKNRDQLTLPLHSDAVALLRARQELNGNGPWVFPGPGRTGHLAEPKKGWQRICARAGIKDLRIHDLRRTFGSYQAARGASLHVIGKSLGHRNVATTAIYARLNLDPVRESVTGAVNDILVAGGVKQSAEVRGMSGASKLKGT